MPRVIRTGQIDVLTNTQTMENNGQLFWGHKEKKQRPQY